MRIPPKGSPLRAAALAANAATVLGACVLTVGLLVGFVFMRFWPIGGMVVIGGFSVPAVVYFVLANRLRARKPWASLLLLVCGGLHALICLAGLFRGLAYGMGGVIAVFHASQVAIATLMLVYAFRAYPALCEQARPPQGFEPIMAQPATGIPEWYYLAGHQQLGPVSWPTLKALAASGALRPEELVWRPGMRTWVASAQVEGLMASAAAPCVA